jgi:uncharacterized protein (DUF433 family)
MTIHAAPVYPEQQGYEVIDDVEIPLTPRLTQSGKPDKRYGRPPSNKDVERNRMIVEALRAGSTSRDITETHGLSRQRVQQIWNTYGDGRSLTEMKKQRHGRRRQR